MHSSVLRYFDQVARTGSIRSAASVLNVAASAVNRQILNLEAEVGYALFERLSSGVRLTPQGEILLAHVRRTLADWRDTSSEIAAATGEVSGEVRILTAPPLIVSVLSQALIELMDLFPRLRFEVIDANATNRSEQMQTGYPDVALLPMDNRYRGYEVVDTLAMELGAVLSPSHPLAGRKKLSFTECSAHPVILLHDPYVQQHSEIEFRVSGVQFSSPILSNSWAFVREITRSGRGIGFFTPVGMIEELGRGEVTFVPVDFLENKNSKMTLYVHGDRRSRREVATVVDQLMMRFQQVRDLLANGVPERS